MDGLILALALIGTLGVLSILVMIALGIWWFTHFIIHLGDYHERFE